MSEDGRVAGGDKSEVMTTRCVHEWLNASWKNGFSAASRGLRVANILRCNKESCNKHFTLQQTNLVNATCLLREKTTLSCNTPCNENVNSQQTVALQQTSRERNKFATEGTTSSRDKLTWVDATKNVLQPRTVLQPNVLGERAITR